MKRGLGLLSVVLALGIPASATILGQFSMDGFVTVTATTIDWSLTSTTGPNEFSLTDSSGIYTTENGVNHIDNLDITTEPVGVMFGPDAFINFTVDSSVSPLLLNFIPAGTGGTTDCTMGPADGQTCTPVIAGMTSPFTFTNAFNSSTGLFSTTAKWQMSGVTGDGNSWSGVFTSQFVGEPFQTVLSAFNPTTGAGSVANTYSAAEITISGPTSVPEPSSTSTLGIGAGLLLVSVSLKKYRRV